MQTVWLAYELHLFFSLFPPASLSSIIITIINSSFSSLYLTINGFSLSNFY